jgi:hypothetical protein
MISDYKSAIATQHDPFQQSKVSETKNSLQTWTNLNL